MHFLIALYIFPASYTDEYIGINFSSPEMVIYQTFLEGHSSSWSDLRSDQEVVYERVGHGRYKFNIRAFNENDSGTQISSAFELHIKKPIYLTFWFYVIIIGVISALFYYVLKMREKSLRTEQESLIRNLDEKSKDIILKEAIIKERQKVEKELLEAKNKAEMAEQLKSSFLANISHEIRTPMNAIVGMSHLLEDDGDDPQDRKILVSEIISNSESLLVLISDILDLSKLESNQLSITLRPFSINKMISDLKSRYDKVLIKDNKSYILLETETSTEDIEISSDSSRLEQIFTKLLDNAVKYTEKGKISFGYQLNRKSNNIIFYVEDTGIGLSKEKQDIIFDLFRKIEDDKLKLYRGTGIGLTLSRYLVKLLGGDINVESAEHKGSKFYFVLHLGPNEIESKPGKDVKERPALKFNWEGKQILIVEDDDTNFYLVQQLVKNTGVEIQRFIRGEDAIEAYETDNKYDLIILDIKLPGIDGYEVARRIRASDPDVPIVSYTAYAVDGENEKSLQAGCNEYIMKPTNNKALLRILNKYLGNKLNL